MKKSKEENIFSFIIYPIVFLYLVVSVIFSVISNLLKSDEKNDEENYVARKTINPENIYNPIEQTRNNNKTIIRPFIENNNKYINDKKHITCMKSSTHRTKNQNKVKALGCSLAKKTGSKKMAKDILVKQYGFDENTAKYAAGYKGYVDY